MGPEWSALPGAQGWGIIPSRGAAPGLPGPGLAAFPARALGLAALVLTAPHLAEVLCHSLCVSVLLGLGTQFETTVAQISLHILLKSSLHYDYVSPFCLVFK